MLNKNQRKLIILIVLLVSVFALTSSTNATFTLNNENTFKNDILNESNGNDFELVPGKIYILNPDNVNITIDRTITIKSSVPNTVINLNKHGRLFTIMGTGNLTLINITIINGTTSSLNNGGAILNNGGTLNISGSTFSHNTANGHGGAIANKDGTLSIMDSTFSHNTAIFSSGAAIDNVGNLSITGSTFSHNTAGGTGGGAITNNYGSTLSIVGSTFSYNTVSSGGGGGGGAIVNLGGTLSIVGSTFSYNRATGVGGAIYNTISFNNMGILSIVGSTFSHNTAGSTGGGAIHNMGILNVSFSVFYNNTGNEIIYSQNSCNLTDNFYFNPTNTDVSQLLIDFTNQASVYGLYYFKISNNSVSSIGEKFKFNFLSYYGTDKPIINPLADLDIIFYYNGQLFNGFNYKDETEVVINSLANEFKFSFMENEFGAFNIVVKSNTSLAMDLVSGNMGDTVLLNVTVRDHNGNLVLDGVLVQFFVNGVNVGNNTTTNGVAIYHYTISDVSNEIFAMFTGNDDYHGNRSSTINFQSKIYTRIITEDAHGQVANLIELVANLTNINGNPIAGANVSFYYIDGRLIGTAITGTDGIAIFQYISFIANTTEFYVVYEGNETYVNSYSNNKELIVKNNTIINIENAEGQVGELINLIANLTDINGNPISGAVASFYYANGTWIANKTTGTDGIAIFQYISFIGKTTEFYAVYEGNKTYVNSYSNNKELIVNKNNTIITVKDSTGDENSVLLIANLTDINNNPIVGASVEFFVNGVSIATVNTNLEGIARHNYAGLLTSGSYYAVYHGNETFHGNKSINANINIIATDNQGSNNPTIINNPNTPNINWPSIPINPKIPANENGSNKKNLTNNSSTKPINNPNLENKENKPNNNQSNNNYNNYNNLPKRLSNPVLENIANAYIETNETETIENTSNTNDDKKTDNNLSHDPANDNINLGLILIAIFILLAILAISYVIKKK